MPAYDFRDNTWQHTGGDDGAEAAEQYGHCSLIKRGRDLWSFGEATQARALLQPILEHGLGDRRRRDRGTVHPQLPHHARPLPARADAAFRYYWFDRNGLWAEVSRR